MTETVYNKDFYNDLKSTSGTAAKHVVPFIIQTFNPTSVLDVGCGLGEWLHVFQKNGVSDIIGRDGDYVNTHALKIPAHLFRPGNLENSIHEDRTFDLVMSLEVAEHLSEASSETFIDNLTRHGDLIFFSAAVPGQIGTNHINEQWQSYWIEKFNRRGYKNFDIIRTQFWNNPHVAWWYRQNAFIFMNKNAENKYADRIKHLKHLEGIHKPIMHPEFELFISGKTSFFSKLSANPVFMVTNFLNKIRYRISE